MDLAVFSNNILQAYKTQAFNALKWELKILGFVALDLEIWLAF